MRSVYRSNQGKEKILKRYNEILEYWPVPCEKLTIPTSFGDTFVVACGADTDKAAVLLHGSATNSAMWMGDVATLGQTRKVYAIDIIGEPGNSSESRPDSRGPSYGKWLAEVLDGLGVGSAAVVGNSLGGWMALNLAAYAPKRVESLVLIASGGFASIRVSKLFLYAMMGRKGERRLGRLIYGDIEMPEEVLEFGRLIGKHFIPRTKGYGAYSDSVLRNISMPVLYFGGSKDVLQPTMKNAARIKRLIPHADVRVLKGRPHALLGLADDIAEFIDSQGGT